MMSQCLKSQLIAAIRLSSTIDNKRPQAGIAPCDQSGIFLQTIFWKLGELDDLFNMKINPALSLLSLVFPLALSATLPVSAATTQESSSACPSQLEISMQKEPVGLFMVRLTVNGTEGRFLVDSGANRNTLDVTESKRFHPKVTAYENAPPGWGLTTMTVASDAVGLGNEEFGVMNLDFINSAVKRNGGEPYAGQLGATFFINHMAKIDFAKQVVCVTVSSTLIDAKH